MSMSDCSSCWSTPCACSSNYETADEFAQRMAATPQPAPGYNEGIEAAAKEREAVLADETISLPHELPTAIKAIRALKRPAAEVSDFKARVIEALGLPTNGLCEGKRVTFSKEYLLGLISEMAKE